MRQEITTYVKTDGFWIGLALRRSVEKTDPQERLPGTDVKIAVIVLTDQPAVKPKTQSSRKNWLYVENLLNSGKPL